MGNVFTGGGKANRVKYGQQENREWAPGVLQSHCGGGKLFDEPKESLCGRRGFIGYGTIHMITNVLDIVTAVTLMKDKS